MSAKLGKGVPRSLGEDPTYWPHCGTAVVEAPLVVVVEVCSVVVTVVEVVFVAVEVVLPPELDVRPE